MCKTFIYCTSLVLLLIAVGDASAELVGYWKFDEASGSAAYDSSGNGNDATFIGDPQWVDGHFAGALEFDGSGDYLDCGDDSSLAIGEAVTIAVWIKVYALGMDHKIGGNQDGSHGGYKMTVYSNNKVEFEIRDSANASTLNRNTAGGTELETDVWYHVAGVYSQEGGYIRTFVNGALDREMATTSVLGVSPGHLYIGCEPYNTSSYHFNGVMDDLRLYNAALEDTEILAVMEGAEGYPYALSPEPEDGAIIEDTWTSLSWRAGDYAVSHDVYLGEEYDLVNEATPDSDVFRGNQIDTFFIAGFPGFAYPDGLVPGITYYWRIDEVNDADPNSPWKGSIWSFSIPPKTAYNPNPADGAGSVSLDAKLSWTAGFGAKLHTVYFGGDYDDVNNAAGGAPQALTTYNPGSLESAKVYYWRVDEFDASATYKGDVWSFATTGAVSDPQPAYGATDVAMNTTLSWTAADSAASHQLYFGRDKEAVRNADTGSSEYKGSIALGSESYNPETLAWDTTYYWRVDEVNSQGNTSKGLVWVFTTGDFLLVDDFEGYTDDDTAGEAVWQHWIDGYGVADNGAQAGYLDVPYTEQTIVHGGLQSMSLIYDNASGATNSEITLTLTDLRDWTSQEVGQLSLWFRGTSSNATEPLYVSIANSMGSPAVVVHEKSGAAALTSWTQWEIPLQSFADQGISLTNVDSISIGLGTKGNAAAPGGTGTLYIDDIRLDRP
ncbi:MAG: LamG domain-containing protein [Sedimentisphaerales bacterium]|nr:LamG domain-containing protein [Sedimentisphaerales bacterium]